MPTKEELAARPERFILKPSAGRITVRVESVERTTKSGIVLLSDNHAPKAVTGFVEEVCDAYEYDNEDYEPLYRKGDLVIFGKFTGTRVKVGDAEYVILQENEILGRLVPSDQPEAVERSKVSIAPSAIEVD